MTCIILARHAAVSYTHLDVYKRQADDCSDENRVSGQDYARHILSRIMDEEVRTQKLRTKRQADLVDASRTRLPSLHPQLQPILQGRGVSLIHI